MVIESNSEVTKRSNGIPSRDYHSPHQKSQDTVHDTECRKESSGNCLFISYIAVQPVDVETEHYQADGLTYEARMILEAQAVEFIIQMEPKLQKTPSTNPGFDLFEADKQTGLPIKWVEVKAMTGSLDDRSVCLSRTQFECARDKGKAFWLYIVEHASDPIKARILRIKNPVGRAKNFTFDRGWRLIAETAVEPCP